MKNFIPFQSINGFGNIQCPFCERTQAHVGRYRTGPHGWWIWKCSEGDPHFHVSCACCKATFIMKLRESRE
jgi:hypothetical protein